MNLNNNSNYKIELIIEIFKEYSNEYYEYYWNNMNMNEIHTFTYPNM